MHLNLPRTAKASGLMWKRINKFFLSTEPFCNTVVFEIFETTVLFDQKLA